MKIKSKGGVAVIIIGIILNFVPVWPRAIAFGTILIGLIMLALNYIQLRRKGKNETQ